MPKYLVKFNPRLAKQLENHASFIANVSKPAARKFLTEFRELVARLANNPYLFPLYDDPNLPAEMYHKAVFGRWYKVVYYIEDDVVYIDAVVDGRMRF